MDMEFTTTTTSTLSYCPLNESLFDIWIDHGINRCFLETILGSLSLGFIIIFGGLQLFFYYKYANPVELYVLPYSQLFGLQMVLNGVMPLIGILKFFVEIFVFQPGTLYGYMLLSLIQTIVVWPIVCGLILYERNYMLPTILTRGHGLVLLIFWTTTFASSNLIFLNIKDPNWFFAFKNPDDIIQFSLFLCHYLATFGIFILGLKAPGVPYVRHSDSFTRLHPDGDDDDDELEQSASQGSPWANLTKKLKMIAPFIWPAKSYLLQFYVVLSFGTIIIGRIANVYVPLYSKKIVDSMTLNSSALINSPHDITIEAGSLSLSFRYDFILIYIALKVLQGSGGQGLLSTMRTMLWVRVQQYTTREVQVNFFIHLHRLSLRWHLSRKTGEVLRALDRGNESINSILNYIVFSILPTIADIVIAIIYFTMFFDWRFGLIVFITMLLYLIATFVITEWRTKFKRSMNQLDNEMNQRSIDSLLNFETVKYYNNDQYETDRYAQAIINYQKEEWKMQGSLCLLNMIQLVFINAGLLAGSLLCVSMVVNHEGMTVGDYVLFTSYILQLYGPLNFFGTYYRLLQRSFIDMENMLDLFKEKQEIKDVPNAPDLKIKRGSIEFRNVSFSYVPEKEVLKEVSFVVRGGKTTALVGPSGAGKSSIIRLLFRFYDPNSGEILIDGQNVKGVTQYSLRQSIGVIPQDTVLFNDTIKHNILYGKIGSQEEDMIEAARCGAIHDKIMTFPERYDTKVGERGLKLSGGEKQRVCIARTALKSPQIFLLDEATSSLDTQTERQIQSSLKILCENRTSIIVAHRLSTIVHADEILVLRDGTIAECGTHDDLINLNGLYAAMWLEQSKESNNNNGNTSNSNNGNTSTSSNIQTKNDEE